MSVCSQRGAFLSALYVIRFGVILHRALDVVYFLDASLPLLRRGCPLQQPGSFVLKTLGGRRGAASNEIQARCIEGRRISVTFPCCSPLVFAQNGAAALQQHAGRRQPATLECTWAGVSAASACLRDCFC